LDATNAQKEILPYPHPRCLLRLHQNPSLPGAHPREDSNDELWKSEHRVNKSNNTITQENSDNPFPNPTLLQGVQSGDDSVDGNKRGEEETETEPLTRPL